MMLERLGPRTRDYDFPPYRPPSEAESLLLRVTRGCPWNRCTFCSLYKDLTFEVRSPGEVKADIELARELYPDRVRAVFIGDSDSLVLRTGKLVEILEALRMAFPGVERVTSYARARTLVRKPAGDLKKIREAGLTRLHVGLETGDRALLETIRKGATPEEMIEAGKKAKEAGFEYSLYVLLGIGGEEGWERHASATAEVLNAIDPHFIRVRTFVPQPGSPLFDAVRERRFTEASPETILRETKRLLEGLNVTSLFLSDHVTNFVPLDGKLPDEKESMLELLDDALIRLGGDPALQRQIALRRGLTHL
jgi:radical SAM superfamily enzyme YgiQ (UPF0313 family)